VPSAATYFCGLFDEAPANGSSEPEASDSEDEPEAVESEVNPYSPDEGLSAFELVDYLLEMKEKPRVIQSRPGFTAGVVEAAQRVLASDGSDKFKEIAALTKTEYLHRDACLGDQQADQRLMEFVAELQTSEREKIVAEVEFLRLERRAIEADQLKPEDVRSLLTRLEEYLTDRQLGPRHLRMASSTVAAINRLEDDDEREEHFGRFGQLFAGSEDKRLAAYGKKLAKKPESGAAEVTGRQLELAGVTLDGTAFHWDGYRGKCVLVQFWATWCPACLREMKQVAAFQTEQGEEGCQVVGVNLDKDLKRLAEYLDKHDTPWVHLAGEECQAIAKQYSVVALPTLLLVDREGKIVASGHKVADLTDKLDDLQGENEPG
jgi:thiol-disulfide isomerase/thioredoxin